MTTWTYDWHLEREAGQSDQTETSPMDLMPPWWCWKTHIPDSVLESFYLSTESYLHEVKDHTHCQNIIGHH